MVLQVQGGAQRRDRGVAHFVQLARGLGKLVRLGHDEVLQGAGVVARAGSILPLLHGPVQTLKEITDGERLGNEIYGPVPDCLDGCLDIAASRYHHDKRGIGALLSEGEAASVRKVHVEEKHVVECAGDHSAGLRQRPGRVARESPDLQHGRDERPYLRLVLQDKDPGRLHLRRNVYGQRPLPGTGQILHVHLLLFPSSQP